MWPSKSTKLLAPNSCLSQLLKMLRANPGSTTQLVPVSGLDQLQVAVQQMHTEKEYLNRESAQLHQQVCMLTMQKQELERDLQVLNLKQQQESLNLQKLELQGSGYRNQAQTQLHMIKQLNYEADMMLQKLLKLRSAKLHVEQEVNKLKSIRGTLHEDVRNLQDVEQELIKDVHLLSQQKKVMEEAQEESEGLAKGVAVLSIVFDNLAGAIQKKDNQLEEIRNRTDTAKKGNMASLFLEKCTPLEPCMNGLLASAALQDQMGVAGTDMSFSVEAMAKASLLNGCNSGATVRLLPSVTQSWVPSGTTCPLGGEEVLPPASVGKKTHPWGNWKELGDPSVVQPRY